MRRTRRSLLVGGAVALSGCSGLLDGNQRGDTCEATAAGWTQFQGSATNNGRSPNDLVAEPASARSITGVDDRYGGAVFSEDSVVFWSDWTLYAYADGGESEQWSADFGPLLATPATYCDLVLATTRTDVVAVDASDGSERWRAGMDSPTCPLAVAGNTVVVSASDGVHALAAAEGETYWTFDRDWSTNGVCATDRTVFVTGGDGTNGYVEAVDVTSGDNRWGTRLPRNVWHPPVYDDGRVIVVDVGGTVYRLDAAGGEIDWQQPIAGDRVPIPLVTDSLVVVGGGYGNRTYALEVETGEQRWELETGPVHAPPVAAGEEIYVGTMNRGMFALAHDGTVQWHHEEPNVGSPMAVHDGGLVFKSRFPDPQLYRLGP